MSSEQGFRGIPGVPEGYELLRIDYPVKGDVYARNGEVCEWVAVYPSREAFPIIRKIETPKKFRPFANAEEFKPHRDRWTMHTHEPNKRFKPGDYNDSGVCRNDRRFCSYEELLESGLLFEDGTPFGVEITSENPAS